MLFVENVRTCRMLYVMMGLRVADCTRASSTEGFRFFEVCQSLFGQDRILRVNTCEPVCVRNGLHVHTCWVNVYILQLQISVFFLIFLPARHSVTSSKDIALCTSFYGCWRTWKAHISVADECRCDEKRTSRLKGMSEKVFCMGVLAWDSVCIRGGVFPGRCMCVPNSCVRVSLCVCLRRWICKCVCLGEWSAWLSPR